MEILAVGVLTLASASWCAGLSVRPRTDPHVHFAGLSWVVQAFTPQEIRWIGLGCAALLTMVTSLSLTAALVLAVHDPAAEIGAHWGPMLVAPPAAMLAVLVGGPWLARRRWTRIEADCHGLTLMWPWPWRLHRMAWDEVEIHWSEDQIEVVHEDGCHAIWVPEGQRDSALEVTLWLRIAKAQCLGPQKASPPPPHALVQLLPPRRGRASVSIPALRSSGDRATEAGVAAAS